MSVHRPKAVVEPGQTSEVMSWRHETERSTGQRALEQEVEIKFNKFKTKYISLCTKNDNRHIYIYFNFVNESDESKALFSFSALRSKSPKSLVSFFRLEKSSRSTDHIKVYIYGTMGAGVESQLSLQKRIFLHNIKVKKINFLTDDISNRTTLNLSLSDCNFKKTKFEGTTFEKSCINGSDLNQCEFKESKHTDASYSRSFFTESSFNKASVTRTELKYLTFMKVDLSDASITNSVFTGSTFTSCTFSNTGVAINLAKNTLEQTVFSACTFSNSHMFLRSQMRNCKFIGTELSSLNMRSSTVNDTAFLDTKATGLTMSSSTFKNVIMTDFSSTGLVAVQTKFINLTAKDSRFYSAKFCSEDSLGAASFKDSKLVNCHFAGANLNSVSLINAILTGSNFASESIQTLVFQAATMHGADLTGADLTGANLSEVDLRKANFTNANLTNVNFTNAILDDAIMTNAILTGANLTHEQLTAIMHQPKELSLTDDINEASNTSVPLYSLFVNTTYKALHDERTDDEYEHMYDQPIAPFKPVPPSVNNSAFSSDVAKDPDDDLYENFQSSSDECLGEDIAPLKINPPAKKKPPELPSKNKTRSMTGTRRSEAFINNQERHCTTPIDIRERCPSPVP